MTRLSNFDAHLKELKTKETKQVDLQDKENEAIKDLRNREHRLAVANGALHAKRAVSPTSLALPELTLQRYEEDLKAREVAVKDVAKEHNIAGYDVSPLSETRISEFVDKFHEHVRRADVDLKRIRVSLLPMPLSST
jgi:DNA repair protein RAD50